jgi:hypothetical protein
MHRADATSLRGCSGCGRLITKAHRQHNGERFCATCYVRCFKHRLCPACGKVARLPLDEMAVCRKCESARPCVRCKEGGRSVGVMTKYGPVCNSCRPYFVEPKPCGKCGKPSNRLSKVSRLGLKVQVCPSCATSDFSTCPGCKRYRLLAEAADGRILCKACITVGTLSCVDCGKLMPAGRVSRCESCYWHALHNKRVHIDQAAFVTPRFAALFAGFGAWLQMRVGGQRAALRIHRYLPFFIEIEQRWREIPTYPDLLAHFGAEGLRRVRLPMAWLAETQCLEVNPTACEAEAEKRRIRVLIDSVPVGTAGALVLTAYRNQLQARVDAGKSTSRSMRLALRPAVSLLIAADASGHTLPDQMSLDHLLREPPGQLASLGGFIRFLNQRYSLGLQAVVDERLVATRRRKSLEAKLLALAQCADGSDSFLRKWVGAGLAYFHGLPGMCGRGRSVRDIQTDQDGYSVFLNGQRYWLPTPALVAGVR